MSNGLRRVLIRGPRETVESKTSKGQVTVAVGKNGGPIIKQDVELVLVPKEQA